ncbi:alpha/beta fold hydrolase [Rhodococcus sp. NPDC019627]|uniref:alpha/beta fold hydrolase n=1 Tax=unclassified Rhodococcus (in: high G+C Gram-positive bacteria) TaxID=192944 RepID=UPI0033C9D200
MSDVLGIPVVFVPALGSDARLWRPVADILGDKVSSVVVRADGSSIEAMADRVLEQTPQDFFLVGNSMGGYVSLEIALRRTGRVRGLALLNSSAIAADSDRRANSRRLVEKVRAGEFDQAVTMISDAVAPQRPDVAELAATMARDLGDEVFIAQQTAVSNRRDRRVELATLDVPTLVIAGEHDTITPVALGSEVADSVPGAELVVLPGVGHLSTLEAPGAVASHLLSWLSRQVISSRIRL